MKVPVFLFASSLLAAPLFAQQEPPFPPPGGPGGPPMMEDREILKDFDKNGDKLLDRAERAAAREFLKANPAPQRGGPPGGGPGGRGPRGFGPREDMEPAKPGVRISPDEVKPSGTRELYAADTLRTIFLNFENDDWEAELEAFHGTDVEVPATLIADGKTYPGVGVHFRGMSSYMMVPAGKKRSFNLSLDHTEKKQRLDGYKTLNLLNSNGDGSFLSAVLYSHIARQHIAAPKVNLVRVVINGENWGVYVNQQQFNKDFIQENFRTSKGARWKVRGSPNGRGGLDYLGDKVEDYQKIYTMKSGGDEDWQALIKLCKTLTDTPADQLEAAIAPRLDLESTLWFLALDCGLINSDGYWTRASDYCLYRDKEGKFHVIPADMNEAFRAAGGPWRSGWLWRSGWSRWPRPPWSRARRASRRPAGRRREARSAGRARRREEAAPLQALRRSRLARTLPRNDPHPRRQAPQLEEPRPRRRRLPRPCREGRRPRHPQDLDDRSVRKPHRRPARPNRSPARLRPRRDGPADLRRPAPGIPLVVAGTRCPR